jgi:glutathione synthase/RimK-type ligase-like ATP-grasp enzyme
MAYRRHAKTGEEVVYTSARFIGNSLYNTKKIRRVTDTDEIRKMVDTILQGDAVVERWIAKATHGGKVYDLRVVYQFGHIAYMAARRSVGHITNLHLNNDALSVCELGLSAELMGEIENLCGRAMALFPGLNSAGIDVLLEAGSLRPFVVEINAQGDLIHSDIYGNNSIYAEQVRWASKPSGGFRHHASDS